MKEQTMFQCFQAVKNTGNGPDAGRAGSIRGTPYTEGQGEDARQLVAVQYDGDEAPVAVLVAELQPL